MMHQIANPVAIYPLMRRLVESFDAATCPRCSEGIPVNQSLGFGHAFITGGTRP